MSRTVILTQEEAERIGREQVRHQNELTGAHNYKFVRVGNLDKCWEGYRFNKYHNLHQSLLVWRIDGAKWNDDREGDEWMEKGIVYVNRDHEFWYVVADYTQESPIWKEYLVKMSQSQRNWLRECNQRHRKVYGRNN